MNSKDELYYSAIDLLHRLIRTPSISREEDAAAQIICETLQKNRFTPYRAGNNVWTFAREFDSEKPTVLLNSHIDTVKPTDSWSRPPFVPIEEDNRLYGLGSNDAGASVVSLLSAFIHLSETEQPYNLVFLASAEEEVSGQNGIVKALEQLPTIDFAVVGEPTGMQPAVCEKGLLVLDCSTYGKSGHAARNEGINALYKATETIEALRTFEFPLASDLLGKVKLTVTQIQAGTQHNVIPDRCDFVVDVRTKTATPMPKPSRFSNPVFPKWKSHLAPYGSIHRQFPYSTRLSAEHSLPDMNHSVLPPSPIKPSCHSPR